MGRLPRSNGATSAELAPQPANPKVVRTMEFDLFTILPLAIAVFVFWKLRQTLGTRNGAERPPQEPYRRSPVESANDDNVVTLPGTRVQRENDEPAADPVAEQIEAMKGVKKPVREGLLAIHENDPSFDPKEFMSGAKMAYEMIVTAFSEGDKRTLKGLLARDVYDNFAGAIDERVDRGEREQMNFVGIEKAEFTAADIQGSEAQITVRFVSQMISATLNSDDEVVDGDMQEVAENIDVWTFARPLKSRDPNWKLVATDA